MTKLLPLNRWKKQSLMKKMKKPKRKSRLSFRDRSERCKQMRRKQSDTSQTRSGFQNSKSRGKSLTANYQKSDPGLHRLCQDLLLAGLQSDSSQKNRSPLQFLVEDNARRAYCIYVTDLTSKYCTSTHETFLYAYSPR